MPALVDEVTFSRVAAIIKGRSRAEPHKNAKERYQLAGKIFCGLCGSAYCGNRQHSGRNKNLLVTYRCSRHSARDDRRCTNKDVNRNYLEDFIFKRIDEIVFSEDRISQLIVTYHESHEQFATDDNLLLNRLHANLKEAQKKIDNIVSVITQTGSPTLLQTLETLEIEKQSLTMRINQEEERCVETKLNEREIIAAYRRAQELFESNSLPQRKQLLNLYLKRVNVFPEYVQIHLHKIPANLKSPSCEDNLPADNDEADLHIFLYKTTLIKHLSRPNKGGTGENLVRTFLGDSPETPANTRVLRASQTTMFTKPS